MCSGFENLSTWFRVNISLGDVEFISSYSLEKEFSKVEYGLSLSNIGLWKVFKICKPAKEIAA